MSNHHYYYLHINGDLISKPPIVVDTDPQYFDSPFVKKVWKIDLTDRADAWQFILEALALGCNVERAKGLAMKWGLVYKDSLELLKRSKPTELMKKGLPIFIKAILNMKEEEYWAKIKEDWNKE